MASNEVVGGHDAPNKIPPDLPSERTEFLTTEDEEVARVLEQYLLDLERGCAADPEDLLTRHAAIAHRLRACLKGLSLLPVAPRLRQGEDLPELADYQVLREIGRGGMGIVYEALHKSDGRHVALKVLPFAAALDPRQRMRFQNEASAVSQLSHPHIVPIHETGFVGSLHFYSMKLIEGTSLSAVIAGQQLARAGDLRSETGLVRETSSPLARLQPENPAYMREVARLMIQAADALQHTHDVGIVHRDIKPGNLLVDRHGELWITDFGLAAIQGTPGLTDSGDMPGTLRYMSPERTSARWGVVDHRSDVYGLGVTMYELLTLRPAIVGADCREELAELTLREPRLPRRIQPAIPVALETIVLKAIAKSPVDRYPTARALADDLSRFLEGRPILAKRPGITARAARWVQRHRGLAATLFVFAITGLVGLATCTALIWMALRSEQQQRMMADARELESRKYRYAAEMTLALQEWDDGNVARVLEFLANHRPAAAQTDLRRFEWFHLWRRCLHARRETFSGGTAPVLAVAADAHDRVWASADAAGVVRIWDPTSMTLRSVLPVTGGKITALTLSRDGQQLAAACHDGAVRLWDLGLDPPEEKVLRWHSYVTSVAFSEDGQSLYSGGDRDSIVRWDTRSGERCETFNDQLGPPNCIAISPDQKTLVLAGNDCQVSRVNLQEPTAPPVQLGRHRVYILCVAFSPDGSTMISGSEDGVIQLWDMTTGTLQKTQRLHTGAVAGAAFSPDGQSVATVSWDGSIKVWDPKTGEIRLQQGHAGQAFDVCFSGDGKLLLTGGEDGTLSVWDLAAPSEPLVLNDHTRLIRALTFSPAGNALASVSADGTARLWDLAGRRETLVLQPAQTATRPDWMLTQRWEDGGGDPNWIMGVVFHADGRQLITADFGGRMRRWDTQSGRELEAFEPADRPLWSLTMAHDGRTLAGAGYTSKAVILWDVASRKRRAVLEGHTDRIWCVAFSPDDQSIVSAANDLTLRQWSATSGALRSQISMPARFPFAMAWSPDGRHLAACGEDCRIRLWHVVAEGEPELIGQTPAAVRALAFLNDGVTLVSGSDDGMVRFWDLPTRQERASFRASDRSVWSVAVSRQGELIATGDVDGKIVVWNSAPIP